MSIIYILWLRQLKRYLRSRARIIGSVGQPLLFLIALGFGLGPVFQKAGHGNYIQFLAPGVISMGILFTAVFSGIEVIWDRQFGFLKETLVAPVSRFQIVLGRTLGGATVAFLQGLVVFILTLPLGFHPRLEMIFLAFIFMFFIALFFTALGTSIASVLKDLQGFQLIMNFIVMPTFFLSGALFPIRGLSKIFKLVVRINPLAYGVDGLRGTLVGINYFGLGFDLMVVGLLALLFLIIGAYLFSKIQI